MIKSLGGVCSTNGESNAWARTLCWQTMSMEDEIETFFREIDSEDPRQLSELRNVLGRAISQAVTQRLPTSAARVQARVSSCGIFGGQSGIGAGFLRVHRFPLPIRIPPITPQSSSIIWGWYNRPNSGHSAKWTQSHPMRNCDVLRAGGWFLGETGIHLYFPRTDGNQVLQTLCAMYKTVGTWSLSNIKVYITWTFTSSSPVHLGTGISVQGGYS
jgi:hypothetical protein